MLAPHNRQLFLDLVRPPAGYQFDCGLGTTFTLDLITLLTVPLSLSLYDVDTLDEALLDPLVILQSLDHCTNKLGIFCQAGYISIPRQDTRLFHYLESMVVEAQAPAQGIFHPKLWLFRYISRSDAPVYRLLNLSRNLTSDRSWDISLCLEGRASEQSENQNQPLVDFISALPGLSAQSCPANILQIIEDLAESLPTVSFETPTPFQNRPKFFPIGIPGNSGFPFVPNEYSRKLVISPFLTDGFLAQISSGGGENTLISQDESLLSISQATLGRFPHVFTLKELPEMGDQQEGDGSAEPSVGLRGLHAKLFVLERDSNAYWLVGSANATQAAFSSNVEFMVALEGDANQVGIDVILGKDGEEDGLRTLLLAYESSEGESFDEDSTEREAEELADRVRRWLVQLQLSARIRESEQDGHDLEIESAKDLKAPAGRYEIKCWPITLSGLPQSFNFDRKARCCFLRLSPQSLTPFVAFDVTAQVERRTHKIRFVLNLPVSGMPEDRFQYLLAAIFENPSEFLRYLRILLAADGWGSSQALPSLSGGSEPWQFNNSSDSWNESAPLLEDLARALSRSDDKRIDRIAELVENLQSTPRGQALIPPEFGALWGLLAQAREELRP